MSVQPLQDVILSGAIPTHQDREMFDSYVRRVWRAGCIAGASWGLEQAAVLPVIVGQPPEPQDAETVDESPEDQNLSAQESSAPAQPRTSRGRFAPVSATTGE
jgi:hypothetical protein